jgi:hypothetical protein
MTDTLVPRGPDYWPSVTVGECRRAAPVLVSRLAHEWLLARN